MAQALYIRTSTTDQDGQPSHREAVRTDIQPCATRATPQEPGNTSLRSAPSGCRGERGRADCCALRVMLGQVPRHPNCADDLSFH